MAKAAAAGGGSYTSHIRDEGDYGVGVVAAVDEVITIAESAGLTGVVTHMKALGPASWGLSKTLVAAHRGGARSAACACSPISIRTRRAARESSAR